MDTWNLIGHQWAVELLQSHIAGGSTRHAYLITGPQGVGRRTLAIRFMQALNQVGVGDFAYQQYERMQHPDLLVLETLAGKRDIGIDQVREIQRGLALHPHSAQFKIALGLNFENASPSAENALLKTLEEPPSHTIMLLTAESSERLLPTTVSRCELIRLRPVPLSEATAGLQLVEGISPERAQFLAHISGGRPGYALRLHNDAEFLEQRAAWLDDIQAILLRGNIGRFAYAQKIAKDKEVFSAALQIWLSFWRDILNQAGGSAAPVDNLDLETEIHQLSQQIPLQQVRLVVENIEKTANRLRNNVNPRLSAETLLLDFPRL